MSNTKLSTTSVQSKCSKKSILSQDCSRLNWSDYFDSQEDVQVLDDKFHVYKKGSGGPLLLAIHGAGYSALTWALFAKELCGKIECQILSLDLRGHGDTVTKEESDFSLETLSGDVVNLLNTIYDKKTPPLILIGHSLGGSIAVEVSKFIENVVGVCVIDVVEGTAIESLSSMQNVIRSRPKHFESVEDAIRWNVLSKQTCNLEAARVSMPGQIRNKKSGLLAAQENTCDLSNVNGSSKNITLCEMNVLKEDLSTDDSKIDDFEFKQTYEWRISLNKTEPFWDGWFRHLSQKFLNMSAPKLLILARINGLDTPLTVGQMQGKFQLEVLAKAGHAVHEDYPEKVAEILSKFLVKQKICVAKN